MNALQEQFVLEARDLIHEASDNLIALERDGYAAERIERVFRAFHTLKGAAGVIGLPPMSVMLHAAEDLLAAVRDGLIEVTPVAIDGALACLDQLSHWVDDFAEREALPSRASEDAQAMVERLHDLAGHGAAQSPTNSRAPGTASDRDRDLPDWLERLRREQGAEIAKRLAAHPNGPLLAVSYEPRTGCFFDGDDPLALMRKVPRLVALRIEEREPWPPLAELDPYTCNLRLCCLSAASRDELRAIFRLVPDQICFVDVSSERLGWGGRAGPSDKNLDGVVHSIIAEQCRILDLSEDGDDFVGRIGAAVRAATNALRHEGKEDEARQAERAGASAIRERDATPLVAALDEILDLAAKSRLIGADEEDERGVDGTTGRAVSATSRSLRVEEGKIDRLVNLAGELLVVKNGFAHLAKQVQGGGRAGDLAESIRRERDGLERLVGEMHAAILQLRMVAVAQVFRLFPRLVRDMAQQLNKKVQLATRGETTESDKAIVDALFEPLVHLVRNALDHGIESAAQRRTAGKADIASLILQASRAGDRFVVEVIDDGGGIDPAVVRRRAMERGLHAAEELAALADEQIVELIFAPGFSTSTKISDISGRGVGMDVVRTTVERIGGHVSVHSRVGVGTTVRLDLPVNIAVSRLMVVQAGGQTFGIALDAVAETILLPVDRISRIKQNDGFVLRDRIVPICSLAELMGLPSKSPAGQAERLVIVTEAGSSAVALEVDAIRDRLEVILKPMQGLLSNARGYSGTALLGDGGVLLVLNLKELLS